MGSPLHFFFLSSFFVLFFADRFTSTVYHSQQKRSYLYFFRYLLVKSKIVQEDDGFIYSKANRERYIEAMCKLIPLFFLGPNEDDPIVLDPKKSVCCVLKPTPLTAPGRDQIVKDKFFQKNGPISKQVVLLFLSPPCYLESPFLATKSNPNFIKIPKRTMFPCSILSQPEVNQRSVVVKNVCNFIESYHELGRNNNHEEGRSNPAENDAILVLYAASLVKEGATIKEECQIRPVLSSQQSSYHLKAFESTFCDKHMLSQLFELIVSYSLLLLQCFFSSNVVLCSI